VTRALNLRLEVLGPDWLERSGAEWQDVLQDSDAHPVFMSWAWVQSWWEIFGADRQLRMIGCFDDARLVAVAPFCLDGGRLELVGQQLAGADYLDVVCRRSYVEAVVRVLPQWLMSNSGFSWHRAALEGATEHSIVAQFVRQLSGRCLVRRSLLSVCPVLAVHGDWASFLRTRFDRKRRYNIERQQRVALADNGLTVSFSSDPASAIRALDAVFALHRLRKGQQERATSFTGDEILAFHRRLVTRLAPEGKILIGSLSRGAEVVAAAYCFVGGRSISYFQSGFDPAYERLGVGTVLLVEVMRFAFANDMQEFDFLRGDEAYKYTWASESRSLYRWELFRRTPAGYAFSLLHLVVTLVRIQVRRARQAVHGMSGGRMAAPARRS